MTQSLLQQLREQTRPAHTALEAQPMLTRLLSAGLTEEEYCQLLQSMWAFYQSLEPGLVPATAALLRQHPNPEYRYLPRAPLLANDCRVMGCACPDLTYPSIEPRLDGGEAQLLGVLYVIEGSTQGGRFISRHLANTLGITGDTGASFFNIYQWDSSWGAFRRWLSTDMAIRYQDDYRNIIEGADRTFSALHAHLDRELTCVLQVSPEQPCR